MRMRPALVLLLVAATAFAAWREAPAPIDLPHRRLFEHEEGRAKRLRAAISAVERGPVGSLPP